MAVNRSLVLGSMGRTCLQSGSFSRALLIQFTKATFSSSAEQKKQIKVSSWMIICINHVQNINKTDCFFKLLYIHMSVRLWCLIHLVDSLRQVQQCTHITTDVLFLLTIGGPIYPDHSSLSFIQFRLASHIK